MKYKYMFNEIGGFDGWYPAVDISLGDKFLFSIDGYNHGWIKDIISPHPKAIIRDAELARTQIIELAKKVVDGLNSLNSLNNQE